MTIGALIGFMAVLAACVAAGVRSRDALWGLIAAVILVVGALQVVRFGFEPTTFVTDTDDLLILIGQLLMAFTVTLLFALPKSIEDWLFHEQALPELAFERTLVEARQPFVHAARERDDSAPMAALWRHLITATAPSPEWASLADRLAGNDEEWAEQARSGADAETWLAWQARNDQIAAEWRALRAPVVERRGRRAAVVRRVGLVGAIAAAGCMIGGTIGLTSGVSGGAPAGRATVVPEHPPGRRVYLTPLGTFPMADLEELAAFYAVRYDLEVDVLPPHPLVIAPDPAREQFEAGGLVLTLSLYYPEAADPNNVIIGVLAEDIYIGSRPDWRWAFGLRSDQLAVISTARMQTTFGLFGGDVEATRLRKFVTRYIGFAYFGLPTSEDPHSALYDSILSLGDLDTMGEDYVPS